MSFTPDDYLDRLDRELDQHIESGEIRRRIEILTFNQDQARLHGLHDVEGRYQQMLVKLRQRLDVLDS